MEKNLLASFLPVIFSDEKYMELRERCRFYSVEKDQFKYHPISKILYETIYQIWLTGIIRNWEIITDHDNPERRHDFMEIELKLKTSKPERFGFLKLGIEYNKKTKEYMVIRKRYTDWTKSQITHDIEVPETIEQNDFEIFRESECLETISQIVNDIVRLN